MPAPADLVGAWRIESCEALNGDDIVARPFGEVPIGLLLYTQTGAMSVTIMRSGRARFAADDILGATATELTAAFDGYLSYAGTYLVDGDRMRHYVTVSLFPNWVGTIQERIVRLEGDRLELGTAPMTLGGRISVARMRWRKITSRDAA